MPYTTHTNTRSKLDEEVWEEPVRTIAIRYGVSDVALGKVCRKLGVPMPGKEYWVRKMVGSRVLADGVDKRPRRPLRSPPSSTIESNRDARFLEKAHVARRMCDALIGTEHG
jgi:hypothetical protein